DRPDPDPVRAAERDRAGAGGGDTDRGWGDRRGVDTDLPRPRPAGAVDLLGTATGQRPGGVPACAAHVDLPEHLPGRHGAQPDDHRRRPARRREPPSPIMTGSVATGSITNKITTDTILKGDR